MNFPTQHLAILAKYAGIRFIAGAVNHGMFSKQRSLPDGSRRRSFYLIGGYLENRWGDLLGFCILASIGLGCFTGGLQHFPDPPERSSWVVPRGFLLSSVAMYFFEARGRIPLRVIASY